MVLENARAQAFKHILGKTFLSLLKKQAHQAPYTGIFVFVPAVISCQVRICFWLTKAILQDLFAAARFKVFTITQFKHLRT
ncbi:MAG: hypothetical protein AXW12_10345 [Thalassospira sp. Nap_22]|nr:MAG: hypothetical protein AXW12_10345 [Thalassospira sp. Nap_22]